MRTIIEHIDQDESVNLELVTGDMLRDLAKVPSPTQTDLYITFEFTQERINSSFTCTRHYHAEGEKFPEPKEICTCDPVQGMERRNYFIMLGHRVANLAFAMSHGGIILDNVTSEQGKDKVITYTIIYKRGAETVV